jgi:hypothetical protein
MLTDNVPKPGEGAGRNMIEFYVNSPNRVEIAELHIIGSAPNQSSTTDLGAIMVSGTTQAINVHHILNTDPGQSGINLIFTQGYVNGVVHHCKMTGKWKGFAMVNHASWGGSGSYGDGSWAAPTTPGMLAGASAMYFEDNWMTNTDPVAANFFDGFTGARWVIRHNFMQYGSSTSHGTESGGRRRSIRWQEVYENTYDLQGKAIDYVAWFRGGSGVMFNNRVINSGGVNSMGKRAMCRDAGSCGFAVNTFQPWSNPCDGTKPYDQNTDATGYMCVDQPGSGQSIDLRDQLTPPGKPANVSEPIYVWGNTINGASDNCGNFGCLNNGEHAQIQRDVKIGVARPGYTPYTYPHPLIGGTDTTPPAPPSNVRVS